MHGRRQPPGDPRRARSSPSCNLESINNANRISPKQTHLSHQRTKERSSSAKGHLGYVTRADLPMTDRWIHDVSSSDDIDEHRCGFHGPIKKAIGKDEQILSSSHSRGKSSSQRRLLPPTPILLVVGSGESVNRTDMDSDEDDSPPSRESHLMDSDFLDSSTPSSTTDVSLFQTNPSPYRKGRKLPSLPAEPSCRKLSMQLQTNGKALAAPKEPFLLSRNSATRHMSMNNVLAAQSCNKPAERQNLEVPIGSLEAIFRRCSIFSKNSDNDGDEDVDVDVDREPPPTSIIAKGSRSVESICTVRSEKEEPAGSISPEPSLLASSSATRLNVYPVGQTSTIARTSKLPDGAKRSSWPNANNIAPLERRPSAACDLGLLHFSVQYFPVRKRLRVSIAKAEGLAGNLRPDLELSTFIKVFLSPGKAQKQKSHRLVKRSNDTVYNEEFFFVNIDADDIRTKSVEIRLCHRTNKQFHHDLVVGEVKLPLWTVNELTSKHEIHFVRSLIPRQLKKLGRIHLSACLETAARRLTVNIAKIDDLPRFEISGLPGKQ
ncbi:C2 domain protein [Trichuris suis]|nr:C2 domain protein [Trichuris suis]